MDREEMITILEEIIRDPETNPTARCTAIRTLRDIPQPPVIDDFAELYGEDELRMSGRGPGKNGER